MKKYLVVTFSLLVAPFVVAVPHAFAYTTIDSYVVFDPGIYGPNHWWNLHLTDDGTGADACGVNYASIYTHDITAGTYSYRGFRNFPFSDHNFAMQDFVDGHQYALTVAYAPTDSNDPTTACSYGDAGSFVPSASMFDISGSAPPPYVPPTPPSAGSITAENAGAMIVSQTADVGISILEILGVIVAILVGLLVFRWGWKKMQMRNLRVDTYESAGLRKPRN